MHKDSKLEVEKKRIKYDHNMKEKSTERESSYTEIAAKGEVLGL